MAVGTVNVAKTGETKRINEIMFDGREPRII
jgi:hypothetical protein